MDRHDQSLLDAGRARRARRLEDQPAENAGALSRPTRGAVVPAMKLHVAHGLRLLRVEGLGLRCRVQPGTHKRPKAPKLHEARAPQSLQLGNFALFHKGSYMGPSPWLV